MWANIKKENNIMSNEEGNNNIKGKENNERKNKNIQADENNNIIFL